MSNSESQWSPVSFWVNYPFKFGYSQCYVILYGLWHRNSVPNCCHERWLVCFTVRRLAAFKELVGPWGLAGDLYGLLSNTCTLKFLPNTVRMFQVNQLPYGDRMSQHLLRKQSVCATARVPYYRGAWRSCWIKLDWERAWFLCYELHRHNRACVDGMRFGHLGCFF